MKDIIYRPRNVNKFGNIVMIKLKLFQFEKVLDICQITCNEVIHSNYIVSFFNKAIAQM